MRIALTALAVLLACADPGAAAAQDAGRADLELYREAAAARATGDLEGWRDALTRGLEYWGGHGSLRYELARACALTGRPAEAVEMLAAAAGLGFAARPDTSADFASLAGEPGFDGVAALLGANGTTVARADTAFVLPQRDFFPEGIAWDPVSGDFFAGSMAGNRILRWSADGRTELFLDEPDADLWVTLGLKVQADARLLWACRHSDDDSSATAAYVYDLRDGRLVARYDAPETDEHFLNDLALAPDGTAYFTDSPGCRLWRWRPGEAVLSPYLPDLSPLYPNGIAMSPDGRHLFVAHAFGLLVVDPAQGTWRGLAPPRGASLAGIDGLSWFDDGLLAVHNGVAPTRVCHLRLDGGRRRVTAVEVLERGNPLFAGTPTTGTMAEDEYHFIGNSQLGLLGEHGHPVAGAALVETVILRLVP